MLLLAPALPWPGDSREGYCLRLQTGNVKSGFCSTG